MSNLPYISPDLVKSYQDTIAKSSSPSTVKRKAISLNRFFDWAESEGHIEKNPLERVAVQPQTSQTIKVVKHVGTKTIVTVGITASIFVLVFLLTWKLKLPIPFIKNFAQENNNQTIQNTIPATPAVNLAWNLFAKLKITDTNGQPMVGSQSLNFKLFNTSKGGTPLYTSESQTITTDANGSTLVSIDGVPGDLFFQNNELYLEPQMGSSSGEMRIPVSTANTPINSKQGTGPETIPVINSDGILMLAGEAPAIKVEEGNLLIEGQAVTIKSADGSGGNIEINPDANGYVHFLFEGNKGNFLNAQAPNLTSGSLYYGMVPNNSIGYYLMNLQSGSKLTTKFYVDAQGNTGMAGGLSTGGTERLTSAGALKNITGYSQTSGNFTINQKPGDFASIIKTGSALSDVVNITLDERTAPNASDYAALVLRRYNGNNDMALLVDVGNAQFNGQVRLGRFGSNPIATGQASVIYNTTDNLIYYYDGSAWQSLGTAVTTPFSLISSGTNTTAALIVGSGATLDYTGTGTINASSLIGGTWAAPGAIGSATPNTGAFTTLSASSTVNLSGLSTSSAVYTDGSSNLTSAVPTSGQLGYWTRSGTNLYNTNQGDNVGIGTTGPSTKLHIKQANNGQGIRLESNVDDSILYIDKLLSPDVFRIAATYSTTGAYKPITFLTSDLERVRIATDGNVGIGTTSPSYTLDVLPTTRLGIHNNMTVSSASSKYGIVSDVSGALSTGNNFGLYSSVVATGSTNNFGVYSSATGATNNYSFYGENGVLYNSGNVGIGTTSPGTKLQVNGTVTISDIGTGGLRMLTNISGVGAGLTVRDVAGESIIQFGNNMYSGYTGPISQSKAGAMIRLDTRNGTGATTYGGQSYTLFQIQTRAAGVADGTHTVPFQLQAAPTGSFIMDTTGNIGLGGLPGTAKLYVNGNVGIGTTGPTYQLQLSTDSAGKPNGGSWANSSDLRLKTDITTYSNALSKLTQLRGVNFNWINPAEHGGYTGIQGGFIAQEVEKIFPGWVQNIDPSGADVQLVGTSEKVKSLSLPFEFDALVVEAIKEQQIQIASLSGQLANLTLTDTGDLNIKEVQSSKFEVQNEKTGDIIERVAAFANVIAANVKAGAVIASKITTDEFIAFRGTVDNLIAKNIKTQLISPLADGTDVTIQLGNKSNTSSTSNTGKLAIQNADGTEVASIDTQGNATFSGTVNSEQWMVNGEATIAGTLYADEIKSKSLDEIQALLAKVQTDQTLLAEAATWNINTASQAATINYQQLAINDLYVTNQAAINSLSVTNTLTVGSDLVFQSSLDPIYNILYTSIDTLSAPLKLQSLAMAPLEIMAGLVTIDTHGNVNIAGNLFVAGRIKSSGLTLKSDLTRSDLVSPGATESASLLSLQDSSGSQVASVNASGSAQFGSVSTPQLVIAGADATVSGLIVNGIITTNSTVGQAAVPAGTSEITIKNPKVTNYTLVYVTPTSSTQNNVLYVKSKQAGQFVVGFTNPIDIDVNFNWWIVQTSQ